MLKPFCEEIFIMNDGDEKSKQHFTSEHSAIAWASVLGKSAWKITTYIDSFGHYCNKHEKYSFHNKTWEAR